MKKLFSSESVTKGHPDKICDQISDAILDAILREDQKARVACETICKNDTVLVMGEITTSAKVDIEQIVRDTVKAIGYDDLDSKFNYRDLKFISLIDRQSPDIAMGVDGQILGAGDQGMMFGYASDESKELMPMPLILARNLTNQLTKVREENILDYLKPDGKAQVSVEYDEHDEIKRIEAIVVSTQHKKVDLAKLRQDIKEKVILPVIPNRLIDQNTKFYINSTGNFEIGGPEADSGLTGRKIIVDTYGGMAAHGGGAFSGKDPTKVDRSAAYMARYVAKNLVAAGLAKKCQIQLSYAIGIPHPVSVVVDSYGTSKFSDQELTDIVLKVFDFSVDNLIKELNLLEPIYQNLASAGHFGREELGLKFETCDKVEELKKYL